MAKLQNSSGQVVQNLNFATSSSMSRASSSGSLHAQGGSAANTDGPTDDEDSDGRSAYTQAGVGSVPLAGSPSPGSLSYRERRREAHTQAEQKRRDAIKKGYDYLQELVPTTVVGSSSADVDASEDQISPDDLPSGSNGKVSKATVLQKSIDYINHVQQQKKKQDEELSQLRKEVVALQIMRANYEQLVKAQQSHPARDAELGESEGQAVPTDAKFEIFRTLMDTLFDSFNDKVSMGHFSELSACVISWIEEQCKPIILQEIMYSILQKVRDKYQQQKSDASALFYSQNRMLLDPSSQHHTDKHLGNDEVKSEDNVSTKLT